MLTHFFTTADRDVERFAAWLHRMGPGGTMIWMIMLYSVYAVTDCTLYVLRH